MEKIIEVKNLYKSYGDVKAVDGIDFYVERGSFFAFLGPNGAGKSTTIDMISTLLKPDSGEVIIDGLALGKDDFKIKKRIGVVFQDNLLDPLLTVKENLMIRGRFYHKSKQALKEAVDQTLEMTFITDFYKRQYGKLSGGQRRRADIARALLNTPQILFLDEPTTGLDPQTKENVWDMIYNLQKRSGMTIFLTTHYMEEAESSDYIVIIDNGKIAVKGTPNELKENYSSDILKFYPKKDSELKKIITEKYEAKSGEIKIELKSTLDATNLINKYKDYLEGFEVKQGTMNDVFLNVTGRQVRDV